MKLSSPAFKHNQLIPSRYTCDGADVSPPLLFESVPPETKSMAVIVDDPDAPSGTWVHWVLWNIDPGTREIRENQIPSGAMQGLNDFKKANYGGPCPPSGTHRYFFKLYALDNTLDLDKKSAKKTIERAMEGHIIAKADMIGLYRRK